MVGTESQLRNEIARFALDYVGTQMGDERHKHIIDSFNQTKLCKHVMGYNEAYCITALSTFAYWAGVVDVFPFECGCYEAMKKAREGGYFIEDDAYIAQVGDVILFAEETGEEDNKNNPYHVVIVYAVDKDREVFHCVSPNASGHSVKVIDVPFDGKNIRGFIAPKYSQSISCLKNGIGIVAKTSSMYTSTPKLPGTCNVDINDGLGIRSVVVPGEEVKILNERDGYYQIECKGKAATWKPWVSKDAVVVR